MAKRKDRVIIDTNLFISFLINNDFSKLNRILNHKQITLLFSQELLDEFVEVAQRPKFKRYFPQSSFLELLVHLTTRSEFVNVSSQVLICSDSKDNFLLSLAKDGKASHLLTGDKDLLTIKKFSRAEILTISEYLNQR